MSASPATTPVAASKRPAKGDGTISKVAKSMKVKETRRANAELSRKLRDANKNEYEIYVEVDPTYREKLRIRRAARAAEPLAQEYASLGHHSSRVRQLAKVEGLGTIAAKAAKALSENSTRRIMDIILKAAEYANRANRCMINSDDMCRAYQKDNEVVFQVYSFGASGEDSSHTFTRCKRAIHSARNSRPQRRQFPLAGKSSEKSAAPVPVAKKQPKKTA